MAAVIDRFAVFEDTCRAAGVESGVERLRVFLTLPEFVQGEVFADLAARIKQHSTSERELVEQSKGA